MAPLAHRPAAVRLPALVDSRRLSALSSDVFSSCGAGIGHHVDAGEVRRAVAGGPFDDPLGVGATEMGTAGGIDLEDVMRLLCEVLDRAACALVSTLP
jgi:hypothetical protein